MPMMNVLTTMSLALMIALPSFANQKKPSPTIKRKVKIVKRVKAEVEPLKTKGKWQRDKFSTLQSKGLPIADANSCERFEIEVMDRDLIYKVRCGKHFTSGLIPLGSDKDYRVERKSDAITITKISYYGQKVQTSQLEQSLVKIPFVEEVTYVKFLKDGNMAFYKENFSVDDFGRVVQRSFLQAYGLSGKMMKVGKNYQ